MVKRQSAGLEMARSASFQQAEFSGMMSQHVVDYEYMMNGRVMTKYILAEGLPGDTLP